MYITSVKQSMLHQVKGTNGDESLILVIIFWSFTAIIVAIQNFIY